MDDYDRLLEKYDELKLDYKQMEKCLEQENSKLKTQLQWFEKDNTKSAHKTQSMQKEIDLLTKENKKLQDNLKTNQSKQQELSKKLMNTEIENEGFIQMERRLKYDLQEMSNRKDQLEEEYILYQSENAEIKERFNDRIKDLEQKIQDLKLDNVIIQRKSGQYQGLNVKETLQIQQIQEIVNDDQQVDINDDDNGQIDINNDDDQQVNINNDDDQQVDQQVNINNDDDQQVDVEVDDEQQMEDSYEMYSEEDSYMMMNQKSSTVASQRNSVMLSQRNSMMVSEEILSNENKQRGSLRKSSRKSRVSKITNKDQIETLVEKEDEEDVVNDDKYNQPKHEQIQQQKDQEHQKEYKYNYDQKIKQDMLQYEEKILDQQKLIQYKDIQIERLNQQIIDYELEIQESKKYKIKGEQKQNELNNIIQQLEARIVEIQRQYELQKQKDNQQQNKEKTDDGPLDVKIMESSQRDSMLNQSINQQQIIGHYEQIVEQKQQIIELQEKELKQMKGLINDQCDSIMQIQQENQLMKQASVSQLVCNNKQKDDSEIIEMADIMVDNQDNLVVSMLPTISTDKICSFVKYHSKKQLTIGKAKVGKIVQFDSQSFKEGKKITFNHIYKDKEQYLNSLRLSQFNRQLVILQGPSKTSKKQIQNAILKQIVEEQMDGSTETIVRLKVTSLSNNKTIQKDSNFIVYKDNVEDQKQKIIEYIYQNHFNSVSRSTSQKKKETFQKNKSKNNNQNNQIRKVELNILFQQNQSIKNVVQLVIIATNRYKCSFKMSMENKEILQSMLGERIVNIKNLVQQQYLIHLIVCVNPVLQYYRECQDAMEVVPYIMNNLNRNKMNNRLYRTNKSNGTHQQQSPRRYQTSIFTLND